MLSNSFDAQVINNRLRDLYGIHEETQKPRFRVVFSDDRLEKCMATFRDYTESNIFIREVTEVREVQKYPWLEGCWLVERHQANNFQDSYDGDFVYECLFAFPTNMPLNWEAIELVAKSALKVLPVEVDETILPKTQKQADYNEKVKMEKESAKILNILDNTGVQSALHDGGAVVVPHTSFVQE